MRGATSSALNFPANRFGRAIGPDSARASSAYAAVADAPPVVRRGREHESPARRDNPAIPSRSDRVPAGDDLQQHREIERLWREYRKTGAPELRDRLVIHYMSGHVRRTAMSLKASLPEQVDVEDLINESYEHLVSLIERFDIDRDTRFETFASPRLKGAMRDYLRRIDEIPRQWRHQSKQTQRAIDAFLAQHGRRPTPDELRRHMGCSAAAFDRIIGKGMPPVVISIHGKPARGGEDDGGEMTGNVEDHRQLARMGETERADLRAWISKRFERRDQLIIVLYFYEQMTMREIGRTIDCSESRVSQRLDSILDRIRSRLGYGEAKRELCEE
jgi:RNA polymerase sigma factor FliA